MLVFVDESGDTGFKIGQGLSGEFTIALVVFPSHAQAKAASHRIDQLRAEIGLVRGKDEFHFNRNSNEQRRKFLESVSSFRSLVFSVTVNKAALTSESVRNKNSFYNLVCGLAFETAREHLEEANVTLDSTGGQTFKKQIATYLKQKINEPGEGVWRIRRVGMKPSHSDNLLQLADMVCGAVARACHQDKRQTERFRQIIKHREVSVLMWPH